MNLLLLTRSANSGLRHSGCFLARQRNSRLQAEKVKRQATWIERPATRMFVPMSIYEYQAVSIAIKEVR